VRPRPKEPDGEHYGESSCCCYLVVALVVNPRADELVVARALGKVLRALTLCVRVCVRGRLVMP
jgi:hypothetical protein